MFSPSQTVRPEFIPVNPIYFAIYLPKSSLSKLHVDQKRPHVPKQLDLIRNMRMHTSGAGAFLALDYLGKVCAAFL